MGCKPFLSAPDRECLDENLVDCTSADVSLVFLGTSAKLS